MRPAGHQQVPGLARHEGDGPRGPNGDPAHRSGLAVDPGRQVDRQDRAAGGIDAVHEPVGPLADVPNEARAEQRVDDQVAILERDRIGIDDLAVPRGRDLRRIAGQSLLLSKESHGHGMALLRENPGGHEAVPTVLAGTRDHEDPGAGTDHP
jgi:hypothetical protein